MHRLNKLILLFGLIIYTLQGPYIYTYAFIVSSIAIMIAFHFKFVVNKYSVLILFFVAFYSLFGLLNGNPSIGIEIKNWFFWLISLNIGLLIFKYLNINEIEDILAKSVLLLAVVYILLKTTVLPNFYLKEALAEYHNYKTIGPYLVAPILYQFIFIAYKLPVTRRYWFIVLCSVIVVLITGSLQYFIIIMLGVILNTIKIKFSTILKLISVIVGLVFIMYKALPEKQVDKMLQLLNPLESPTVQTRVSDVQFAFNRNDSEPLLGDGLGVRTTVQRVSFQDSNLIDTRDFLEVDNTFYYIYHRMGIFGLVMLVIFVSFLLRKLPIRGKVFFIFFILVNGFLSIHLVSTNSFALVFSFLIMYPSYVQKKNSLSQ